MRNRYYDLNTYFQSIFGCRVQKITIDAGLTCPNRDGTISTGGCIFCNDRGSGSGASNRGLSLTDQLLQGKNFLSRRYKAKKFIAYFQSFSNTYAPPEILKRLYDEALAVEDIVGLAIGTGLEMDRWRHCPHPDTTNHILSVADKPGITVIL